MKNLMTKLLLYGCSSVLISLIFLLACKHNASCICINKCNDASFFARSVVKNNSAFIVDQSSFNSF